jgi:hypothetical protein
MPVRPRFAYPSGGAARLSPAERLSRSAARGSVGTPFSNANGGGPSESAPRFRLSTQVLHDTGTEEAWTCSLDEVERIPRAAVGVAEKQTVIGR